MIQDKAAYLVSVREKYPEITTDNCNIRNVFTDLAKN